MTESLTAARSAGLRWLSDEAPGIRRLRAGRGFKYVLPSGRPLTDGRALARIRSLAVPPAWTDVWICLYPRGHMQATGRDAKGRKQYRYHARWHVARDETKYDRLLEFGRALPRIRQRVQLDLGRRGLPREKAYVHPAVAEAYLHGSLRSRGRRARGSRSFQALRPAEAALLGLLSARKQERSAAHAGRASG